MALLLESVSRSTDVVSYHRQQSAPRQPDAESTTGDVGDVDDLETLSDGTIFINAATIIRNTSVSDGQISLDPAGSHASDDHRITIPPLSLDKLAKIFKFKPGHVNRKKGSSGKKKKKK